MDFCFQIQSVALPGPIGWPAAESTRFASLLVVVAAVVAAAVAIAAAVVAAVAGLVRSAVACRERILAAVVAVAWQTAEPANQRWPGPIGPAS